MVRGEIERFLLKMDFYYYKYEYILTFYRKFIEVLRRLGVTNGTLVTAVTQ